MLALSAHGCTRVQRSAPPLRGPLAPSRRACPTTRLARRATHVTASDDTTLLPGFGCPLPAGHLQATIFLSPCIQ